MTGEMGFARILQFSLIVAILLCRGPLAAQTFSLEADIADVTASVVVPETYHDVSPRPIGEIAPIDLGDMSSRIFETKIANSMSWAPLDSSSLDSGSAISASSCVPQSTLDPINTADGPNFLGPQGGTPPDPNGAVGATQVVQFVNSRYQVFDKYSGSSLYGPALISNTIFSGFPGYCGSHDDGDGIVNYDRLANRWLISQFSRFPNPYFCIGVSATSDATGPWYRYQFDLQAHADMPFVTVWPNGYYVATDSSYAKLWVLDRAAMLVDATASAQAFTSIPRVQIADLDGLLPPAAGSPAYAFVTEPPSTIRMWRVAVNWPGPSPAPQQAPDVTACSWSGVPGECDSGFGAAVRQKGTTQRLQPIIGLSYRVAYRNFGSHESITFAQGVGAPSPACATLRWYELRFTCASPPCNGTPELYQEGEYSPDSKSRFNACVAMDGLGNLAMGYSKSGSGQCSVTISQICAMDSDCPTGQTCVGALYPEIWYTGRRTGDPLGTLAGEKCIVGGSCSTQAGAPQPPADGQRVGDYTSMMLDPSFDCRFYYTNQYNIDSVLRRFSRVGAFEFPDCANSTTLQVGPLNTYVDNKFGNTNFGTDTYLVAGRQASTSKGGLPELFHTLLQFDLSVLPAGASVRSAVLWLYISSGVNKPVLSIERLTSPFDFATATWFNTGNGGATSTPPAAVTVPITPEPGFVQINVTSLAVDCRQNRASQCYWRLSEVNETDNTTALLKFISEDGSVFATPRLEIGYRY